MPKDYMPVIEKYSEQQFNKAHDIISDLIEQTEEIATQERSFESDVRALKVVQKILEICINYDPQ